MLKHFVLLSTLMVLGCRANGYMGIGFGGGYSHMGGGYSGGHYGGGYGGHAVPAAVISHHNVKEYPVHSKGYITPVEIDVPANVIPVNFVFRSSSSHILVKQVHDGAKGSYKESHSQDEPHVLKHSVTKPIIQEVKEVIIPSRKIVQEIKPVHEEIKTLVAKGHHGYGHSAGGYSAGGFGGFSGGALGHSGGYSSGGHGGY